MLPLESTTNTPPAGVDITTGYSADSFLGQYEVRDVWAKQCFMTLVDTSINHLGGFYYPLPTAKSAKEDRPEELPKLLHMLRNVGVIHRLPGETAEHLITYEAIEQQYPNFRDWAITHKKDLKSWLDLHYTEKIKQQHHIRIEGDVQTPMGLFWRQNIANVEQLEWRTRLSSVELCYAFDVMFRGIQYSTLLANNDVFYFPHPLRLPLLSDQKTTNQEYLGYSWGRLLITLIEQALCAIMDETTSFKRLT